MPTPCDPVPTPIDHAAALEALALEPASATVDGSTVTAHPLGDVADALDRAAARKSLTGPNPHGGPRSGWGTLRPARVVPPGAS